MVRFSLESESKFVVSTKWNGKFIHTTIKTEIDTVKKQLLYFINDRFKFISVFDLICFHKENQYPLSESSGAVLYKQIDINNIRNNGFNNSQRESKFRKSTNMFRKHPEKRGIPRSGSETYLTNQRYSNNFPDLNKSLTNLSAQEYDAPHKPKKPSFKLLNSKHLLLKLRPSNIKIRNKKLYKDSGDYTEYAQVKETDDAMRREKMRRGISLENRSPSLFGLNSIKKEKDKKKHSMDSSIYVLAGSAGFDHSFFQSTSDYEPDNNNNYRNSSSNDHYIGDDRESVVTLTANTPVTSTVTDRFDVYGFDRLKSPVVKLVQKPQRGPTVPSVLGLVGFVNLALSSCKLSSCGPVAGTFDKAAINKVSTYLLNDEDNHAVLCRHLLAELRRVFAVAAAPFSDVVAGCRWSEEVIGYRWIFMPGSAQLQRDLSIRQTALAHFIMATIVSTTSTEKRINLIFFWIRCADYLLTRCRDMYHFTAVFSAIFSDQILNLRVWKIVYRQDPSARHRMESLKETIKNGGLLRTDIGQCVPDLVQLCNIFSGNEDLDVMSNICFDMAMWSDQAFCSSSTWLVKIMKELDSTTVIPYFRELVQTETLLCMILGPSSINHKDVTPLFDKISDCIRMMAKMVNDNHT